MGKDDTDAAVDAIIRKHFYDDDPPVPDGLEDAIYDAIVNAVSAALDDVETAITAVRRDY